MTPNRPLAKQLALREVPALVYDAVNLEGLAFTLPEVQTLLDGITVGGHKISDQNIVLNQAAAWKHLFALVEEKHFSFCKKIALEIHAVAAREEAMAWGRFRSGNVTISGSDYLPPPAEELDAKWDETLSLVEAQSDIYDKATTAFLQMARHQFFWDVNKRTGRFMMNGILLDAGFPVINVPVKRQQEFNSLMLAFYTSGKMQPMNNFLRSCLDERIIDNFRR